MFGYCGGERLGEKRHEAKLDVKGAPYYLLNVGGKEGVYMFNREKSGACIQ
jgi:hypothetical protein